VSVTSSNPTLLATGAALAASELIDDVELADKLGAVSVIEFGDASLTLTAFPAH